MDKKRERINKIINTLRINNAATVRELAEWLSVSKMTIRRDLNRLAADNMVKLIHGGVIFNRDQSQYYLPVEEARKTEEKIRIGKKAASLIEPHDTIIIDTGSTTEFVARSIPDNLPVTILCYALNILFDLQGKKGCTLIFAGGYYHDNTMMFESPEGVNLIKRNRANKAFISASGVSEKLGVTCSNPYEIETKKAAINSTLTKILLVDSSKYDKIQAAHFANLTDFDIVITDTGIPGSYVSLFNGLGIKLYVV